MVSVGYQDQNLRLLAAIPKFTILEKFLQETNRKKECY